MKRIISGMALLVLGLGFRVWAAESVPLPEPSVSGGLPLNEVLKSRRSVRDYKAAPLSLEEFSQLLWSAQGITDAKTGHRTAPSAVARYPLKLYAVVKSKGVTGLEPGVYLYQPKGHRLSVMKKGDFYQELIKANAFFNKWISDTDVVFVVGGMPGILQKVTPESGNRFMDMEGGMAAENLMLAAVSLGLGACPVGGFTDSKVSKALGIPEDTQVMLLVPVGKKQ